MMSGYVKYPEISQEEKQLRRGSDVPNALRQANQSMLVLNVLALRMFFSHVAEPPAPVCTISRAPQHVHTQRARARASS